MHIVKFVFVVLVAFHPSVQTAVHVYVMCRPPMNIVVANVRKEVQHFAQRAIGATLTAHCGGRGALWHPCLSAARGQSAEGPGVARCLR